MSVWFFMGLISRGKIDPENDPVLFEATVRHLQSLILEQPTVTSATSRAVHFVAEAARVILRHRYEGCISPEDLEGFHRAVDHLKRSIDFA